MSKHTVYICEDPKLTETLDTIAEKLREQGVTVIRGTMPEKGIPLQYPDEKLQELFGEAEVAMFTSRNICDSRIINAAPKLRGIVNPTIGVETVDVKLATERGILVANGAIPENYIGMAESTVMLILMLMYDPVRSMHRLRDNLPEPTLYEHWAKLMCNKTLGILGLGRIGRGVAERLNGWGMDIISYDPYITQEMAPDYVTMVDLDTFYARSDIIGVFLTVTDETRNMLGDAAFAKMKDGVSIVNTARGQLIDEDALVRAIKSGKVASAALDVFQKEPLPIDSPLRTCENLILTPHCVGHALETQLKLADAAVDSVTRILAGQEPVYLVNRDAVPVFKKRIEG